LSGAREPGFPPALCLPWACRYAPASELRSTPDRRCACWCSSPATSRRRGSSRRDEIAATLSAATGAPAGKATPAGADAQPAADAHVQRQGLDREVAQGAGRADGLETAPLAQVDGVLGLLGQLGQRRLAALGQAEARPRQQAELEQQRADGVPARGLVALDQALDLHALQQAVAGGGGQPGGRRHIAQAHALAPARGHDAQHRHQALDALRAAARLRPGTVGRHRGLLAGA
jgi:hypothetical protein